MDNPRVPRAHAGIDATFVHELRYYPGEANLIRA